MPTPDTHAILSPSAADLWMHCPASVALTKGIPDQGADYTKEGTLAHSIAELKVRKKFVEAMGTKTFTSRMNKLKKDPLYTAEMQGYTDDYLDYISEVIMSYPTRPMVEVEKRLNMSEFVPDCFGTADCCILGGELLHLRVKSSVAQNKTNRDMIQLDFLQRACKVA